jgi:hypothetical protein
MKIELKNIHHSEQLSEETNAFSANLYINGIKAGVASNRGNGGPTDYYPANDKGRQLIKEAEDYCKTLPPHVFEMDGVKHSIDMNLEMHIDNLLVLHLQQKDLRLFQKEMDKAMRQGIVVGVPDKSFGVFKLKQPITLFLSSEQNRDVLTNMIRKHVLPSLKEGDMILNDNIPGQILLKAGIKEGQYLNRDALVPKQKKPVKKKGKGI